MRIREDPDPDPKHWFILYTYKISAQPPDKILNRLRLQLKNLGSDRLLLPQFPVL